MYFKRVSLKNMFSELTHSAAYISNPLGMFTILAVNVNVKLYEASFIFKLCKEIDLDHVKVDIGLIRDLNLGPHEMEKRRWTSAPTNSEE